MGPRSDPQNPSATYRSIPSVTFSRWNPTRSLRTARPKGYRLLCLDQPEDGESSGGIGGDTRGENSHAGFESAGAAPPKMESEPTTWRGVISHWKQGRRQVRKTSCEIFRSCDCVFAIFPLRAAVRHADCDRHELVRTIKLCANCDVALATARCSDLTELQMGNLHETVPRLRRIYAPGRTLCVL